MTGAPEHSRARRPIRCTLPFRPARSAGTIGAAIGNAACRASSRLIAAAVVVLALGLASPAQVQAQDVLVGNVDQSAGGNASLATKDYAQGFTTGSAGFPTEQCSCGLPCGRAGGDYGLRDVAEYRAVITN